MTLRHSIQKLLSQEDLNFLLTNRVPRMALTRFMGWFSKIEQPWVRDASIATWKFFTDLDLSEARKQQFSSMHDCFFCLSFFCRSSMSKTLCSKESTSSSF